MVMNLEVLATNLPSWPSDVECSADYRLCGPAALRLRTLPDGDSWCGAAKLWVRSLVYENYFIMIRVPSKCLLYLSVLVSLGGPRWVPDYHKSVVKCN